MPSSEDLEAANLFQVKGYVAVVTGGGRGVGLMAARTLAANGARVYIIGRRSEALQSVSQMYSSSRHNGEIIPLPGDITTPEGISTITAYLTHSESKGINVLINSAHTTPETEARFSTPFTDFADPSAVSRWMTLDGPDAWRQSFIGNVTAHYFLTAALLPLLAKANAAAPGHTSVVINVASVAGVSTRKAMGQFAWSSGEAALMHLSVACADAFRELGVRVNCLAVGVFPRERVRGVSMDEGETTMEGEDGEEREKEVERRHAIEEKIPAGRIGNEKDIGSVILWLCSRAGTYVNGQVVNVDGGVLLKSPTS